MRWRTAKNVKTMNSENTVCFKHQVDESECSGQYHYTRCGLDNIYLSNGYKIRDTKFGSAVAVLHVDELYKEIARHLVNTKKTLTGKEFRFIRKNLDLTQSALGRLLGVDSQTIARREKSDIVENDAGTHVLRMLFIQRENEAQKMESLIELLDSMDEDVDATLCLTIESDESWNAHKVMQAA